MIRQYKKVVCIIIAVLLCLGQFNSLILAEATGGGGSWGGKVSAKWSKTGTIDTGRNGLRVYVVKKSNGELVSNIVDIVHPDAAYSAGWSWMVASGIRTKPNDLNLSHQANVPQSVPQSSGNHVITYAANIDLYTNKSGVNTSISKLSHPIIGWKGNGDSLGAQYSGPNKVPPELSKLKGGGGGSVLSEEYNPGKDIVGVEITGDYGTQIEILNNTLDNNFENFKKLYATGSLTESQVMDALATNVDKFLDEINKANAVANNLIYSSHELTIMASDLQKKLNELREKLSNIDVSSTNLDSNTSNQQENTGIKPDKATRDEELRVNWLDNLIDIAYAEDDGYKPIYSDNSLDRLLMSTWTWGGNVFKFNSSVKIYKDSDGNDDMIMTLGGNNLIVMMEPLFWNRLQTLSRITSDEVFYGTFYNYCQMLKQGLWVNDNNFGGNMTSFSNKLIPWCMVTSAELKTDDGSTVLAPAQGHSKNGQYVYDDFLKDNCDSLGMGLHFYEFKTDGLPDIPTYDVFKPNPDPNTEPHKAPDPDPDDPGNIPLKPAEPPDKYKETTRTVNIVKCYDIIHLDNSVEHVKTFTRKNCPGTIFIQHEPDYKVVAWYTSPEYLGDDLHYGWDSNEELVGPTEWENLWEVAPVTEKDSWEYESVQNKPAGETHKTVKIGLVCDCDKSTNPDTIDGEHGLHYHDNTLYIRLVKKEKLPETSTYDEPDHQPSGTPPAVPPHSSQDPHMPEDPNFDPETTHVEDDDPYCHYRIVKCYETITITDEGEQPPEPDGVFTTYKTNPIVYIQDEAQSADPFDGSWHLEDWDISDDYNPPLPDLWEPLTGTYSSKQGGHSPTKVDLIDKNDREKEVTLYVHLVRRIKEGNPTGAIIIQQSQISKTIHTDDPNIGGYFGNYKFIVRPPSDFPDSHTAYYHHCCVGGDHRYHTCKCLGHTCYHKMPGRSGCNSPVFNFDLISAQDDLEIKKGVNVNTDPKVYGKSGAKHDAIGAGVTYNETISSLKCEADKFTYVSDGNQQRSAEYVTILWRGSPKYKDVPTLAKYKEKDIQLKFGSADNYNIPKDVLASGGTQPNKKSMHKRASQYWVGDLKFTFGLDEGKSHLHVASSCVTHNGYNCVNVVSQDYIAVEGTTFTYDFQAGVAIRFYAGKAKGLVAQPFGAQTNTPILEKKTGTHKELNVIQCKQIIHFYPYIRMTYMLNNLKDAEDEEKNTDANGYVNDVRKDTYVLSEHESTVLPADAVRVEWRNDYGDENLILTSQQWSVHQKAINGVDGNTQVWNGRNQVLPGGAIYQLSTPKDKPVEVILTTYQTVIDQKARNEYLSDPIPSGDEYTEAKVAKDHTDFINDAKEVFDNLKVVQWVNKNPGASTAWAKNFEEKDGDGALCLRGLQEKLRPDLGQDMKETANTEQKYYMRQQTTLSDYQNSKLSEWTRTIDQKQSIEEQTYEGDLDVFNMRHAITVYKLFTDASTGKVYLAQMEKKYSNNDTAMDNNEADIKSMVQSMKDLNADTYSMGQTFGATVTELCDKKIPGTAINNVLSGDAKDIDDATSFITNFVSALTRNKGTDYTAEWANGKQDGRWYNEAFDGAYLVRQRAQFNVGFAFTTNRVSALDPALCPPNKGQSDLYTKAFLSQFCVDSQSDATIAQGKVKNYLGTFKDTDITLPDMESLYVSKRFYIPNANVQDLN